MRTKEEEYMGFLGPILHAEVGDTIEIRYKNGCSFTNTMHPHGLLYDKGSEGTPHDDGTQPNFKKDDEVPPNGTTTFKCAPAACSH
jgi:manganese oxidase